LEELLRVKKQVEGMEKEKNEIMDLKERENKQFLEERK